MRTFEKTIVIAMALFCVILVAGVKSSDLGPKVGAEPSQTKMAKPKKPKLTLEEFVNQDVQCDKPHDVLSKSGLAAAKLCNFSKDTGFTPGQIVTIELSFYKKGIGGVSPYTQDLIDNDPHVRAFLRSTN